MTPINLIEGENMCCGSILNRKEVQERIDRMQFTINNLDRYFSNKHTSIVEFEAMIKELDKLQTYK